MDVLIIFGVIFFSLLQIILFFKLWGMTNDVREIKNSLTRTSLKSNIIVDTVIDGWAANVSETEKMKAMLLISQLKPGQVIAKVASKKEMEIWSTKFWEGEQNNPNYKLIYKN
ncbi:hypothetical protein [uncultured Bacteroides sp.]|uniref:hypothetical protein n=1 Tax=uncultured Bacteroides sp. TaxID=162156 RepID=UPI002AA92F7F|nr:hypothetical protein [uncultured Bacteroides sp.]